MPAIRPLLPEICGTRSLRAFELSIKERKVESSVCVIAEIWPRKDDIVSETRWLGSGLIGCVGPLELRTKSLGSSCSFKLGTALTSCLGPFEPDAGCLSDHESRHALENCQN